MDLTKVIRESSPPPTLSTAAAAIWRHMAPAIVITVVPESLFEGYVRDDPACVERALLAGWARVCTVIADAQERRARGLSPTFHHLDVELLAVFGIRPKAQLN
jgi:hypothetical protein